MGDHLAISRGLLQAPLNRLKTDVSRGPPGLSGGPGPLRPHRNSITVKIQEKLLQCGVKIRGWETFAIVDRNRRLSRKWYEISPLLLWITNKKSQMADRTTSVPVTLSDRERRDATGQIFLANIQNYARMIGLNMTEFGVVT